MAVNANELESRVKAKNADLLRQLEATVDAELETAYRGSGASVTLYNHDLEQLSPFLREALFDRYRQVGWDVNYVSNQRDGNYAEFKVRETSSCSSGQAYSVGGSRPYD